jgi:predicted esterase
MQLTKENPVIERKNMKGTPISKLLPVLCLFLSMLFVYSSCSEESPGPQPPEDEKVLVDATLVYTITSTQVKLVAQLAGIDLAIDEFVHDVDIYKVTYNTSYKGGNVVASGLISFPKTTEPSPVLSYQHGTITRDVDAPSNFAVNKPETLIAGAFSSSGFVTVIPDYVGFGSTATILHPYFVEEVTAAAVVNMLKAAQELADEKNIALNSKLFLAGYSEGGYATMATHKAIEADGVGDLDLVASFPGAGAFDLQTMQAQLFALDTYDDPFYLAYVTLAYSNTYDFSSLLTDFFQEPYAARIPGLFDNQKASGEINGQLTTSIADLLQPELRAGFLTDERYAYIADAFAENALTDWAPVKRMYMYHGTSDKTIPYENSQVTYEALIANGASEDIVSLTPLPGDHTSAVTPYVADLLIKLWSLR